MDIGQGQIVNECEEWKNESAVAKAELTLFRVVKLNSINILQYCSNIFCNNIAFITIALKLL